MSPVRRSEPHECGLSRVDSMKQRRSLEVSQRTGAVLIVLVLLMAGGWFYWYEYRPSMVRAICSSEAEKRADKDEFVYEIIYRHCLRSHGIEYVEGKE